MESQREFEHHKNDEDNNAESIKPKSEDTLTTIEPFDAKRARKNVNDAKMRIAVEKNLIDEHSANKWEHIKKEMPRVFTSTINEKIKEASSHGESEIDFTYSQIEDESKTTWHSGTGYDDDTENIGKHKHIYDGFTGLELRSSYDESKNRGSDSLHFLWPKTNRPIISDVLDAPNVLFMTELYGANTNIPLLDNVSSTLAQLAEDYAKNGFRVYLAEVNLKEEDEKFKEKIGLGGTDTTILKRKEDTINTIRKISWGEDEKPGVVKEDTESKSANEQHDSITKE